MRNAGFIIYDDYGPHASLTALPVLNEHFANIDYRPFASLSVLAMISELPCFKPSGGEAAGRDADKK